MEEERLLLLCERVLRGGSVVGWVVNVVKVGLWNGECVLGKPCWFARGVWSRNLRGVMGVCEGFARELLERREKRMGEEVTKEVCA